MKILFAIIYGLLGMVLGFVLGFLFLDSYSEIVSFFTIIGFFWGFVETSMVEEKLIEKNEKNWLKEESAAKEYKQSKELIETQYGKPISTKNSFKYNNSFSVHEKTKIIIVNKEPIAFSDLRACKLIVDDQVSTSTSTTITKSSTGNVVGRAVVGTLVAGGAGAIIGGLSGRKTGIGNSTTNIITNYSVSISTNNIANPTKIIKCHDDLEYASNLVDTINIIVERRRRSDVVTPIE